MTERYFSNELADAVDQLGPGSWCTRVPGATRSRAPARRSPGGRWNPPGISTIYLASPRETCLAEFGRMAEGQGRGPASFLPRALHTITINQLAVLDLTTDDAMVAVGLNNTDLDGPWDPCQAVGAAAHFLRLAGVIAPSATGAGIVIAVFEAHVEPGQLGVQSTEIIGGDLT